ncbi:hypothetical protein C0993_005095 [Termitomyces sp. T159_Od127]|nr:hypothetical protein C0993_005095 [Termitomyces sp. T159_Od127]
MSGPMIDCLTVTANPDVSGIGVRIAIYAQNLLSFIPAFLALKDGRVTPTELDELEKQSTTILITAFAILISTVIQAHDHGISDYHASIVLDLSWMNNTNLFIYFLLYIYHRANLSNDDLNAEVRASASRAGVKLRNKWSTGTYATKKTLKSVANHTRFAWYVHAEYRPTGVARWIYETKKASTNFVIIIGSFHLSLMGAVGIFLWSNPAGFGGSGLCSLSATISILGKQVQLGSSGLRVWSLLVYSTVLTPMLNLLIPMAVFATPLLTQKLFKSSGNIHCIQLEQD